MHTQHPSINFNFSYQIETKFLDGVIVEFTMDIPILIRSDQYINMMEFPLQIPVLVRQVADQEAADLYDELFPEIEPLDYSDGK